MESNTEQSNLVRCSLPHEGRHEIISLTKHFEFPVRQVSICKEKESSSTLVAASYIN